MNLDLIGLLAFGLAAAQVLAGFHAPTRDLWWRSRWLFVLLLGCALFVFQRDAIRANFQIWNPDESQLIAGALALPEYPVFWRDVDGTTHGPLAQYPLLLPTALGARLDYTSARIVSACLTIALLASLHAALAVWLTEAAARLAIFPAWAWLIFNQDPELAQYTTELTPSLLIALAAWPAARLLASGSLGAAGCALGGALAGAAPFAKLQATPLALWIFGCLLVAQLRSPPAGRTRRIAALFLGGVLPAALLLAHAAAGDALVDFRVRYLEVNLRGYVAEGATWFNDAPPLPGMLFGFNQFLWPLVALTLGAGTWLVRHRSPTTWKLVLFTAGLAASATFAVWAPHKPFAHYFLLLAGPLVLLFGAVAAPALARLQELSVRQRTVGALLLLFALSGPSVWHHFRHPDYFRTIVRSRPPLDRSLIEAVQRHTTPGGGLAVWGWQPGLYVFTQTRAATPDLVVFWPIVPSPWRDFYRERYLQAFSARPPPLFVDTIGPADFFFFRHPSAAHEDFPALRDLIARDYTLAETVAGARLYTRRDRTVPVTPAL